MHTQDEFHYGRRQRIRYDKTGQPIYTWLPLERQDFLDPQEGDEFAHGPRHAADVQTLRRILRAVQRFNPATVVLSAVKIRWPQPGLPAPAPDLAIVTPVSDPGRRRTLFDLAAEGAAVPFILEVTSPQLAELDLVDKRQLYENYRVGEYFILHSDEDALTGAVRYQWFGYRLEGTSYQPIQPDNEGRLYSATNWAWFAVAAGGVTVIDERSGQPLLPDPQYDEPVVAAEAEAAFRAGSIAAQLDFLRGE